METVLKGWLRERNQCPFALLDYWNYRDELGVQDGLLLKESRIVTPENLKLTVLFQLHAVRRGAEKIKLLTCPAFVCVRIHHDIMYSMSAPPPASANEATDVTRPLTTPRHTIANYLFHWNASDYLLLGDTFSRFPSIRKLSSTPSITVINHMKSLFD